MSLIDVVRKSRKKSLHHLAMTLPFACASRASNSVAKKKARVANVTQVFNFASAEALTVARVAWRSL
jgi:hypothetical protein